MLHHSTLLNIQHLSQISGNSKNTYYSSPLAGCLIGHTHLLHSDLLSDGKTQKADKKKKSIVSSLDGVSLTCYQIQYPCISTTLCR